MLYTRCRTVTKEYLEQSRIVVPLKVIINQAFAGAITKKQLQYNLFQSGIGVVYWENAAGCLHGVTFIDYNTGVVLNGPRLGKEYSVNGIIERLATPITERDLKHHFRYNNPERIGGVTLTEKQRIALDGVRAFMRRISQARVVIDTTPMFASRPKKENLSFSKETPIYTLPLNLNSHNHRTKHIRPNTIQPLQIWLVVVPDYSTS